MIRVFSYNLLFSETPSNNIFLKQQFPKHMRRRAMSQNVKRIPKRLREHQIDMVSIICYQV